MKLRLREGNPTDVLLLYEESFRSIDRSIERDKMFGLSREYLELVIFTIYELYLDGRSKKGESNPTDFVSGNQWRFVDKNAFVWLLRTPYDCFNELHGPCCVWSVKTRDCKGYPISAFPGASLQG